MGYPQTKEDVKKPTCFDEMVWVAEVLAKDFDHVRVDLYESDNQVYFGELTFTSASGLKPFQPAEWDLRLGQLWRGTDAKKT